MQAAFAEVKAGSLNCCKASKKYRIPYTTLNEWVNDKRHSHKHGKTVLTTDEEADLTTFILNRSDLSRALTLHIVKTKVSKIVKDGRDHPPGVWQKG